MTLKNLVKRVRGRHESMPEKRSDFAPFRDLQSEMNNLFEDFFTDFPLAPYVGSRDLGLERFSPLMDVSETDKEVKVSAELPGMDEKDITVEMDDSTITIKGEKKAEKEEKGKNWYRKEQSYGSFHRSLDLPSTVDGAKAKAQFKKGLLTVTAPKREEEQSKRKTITIKTD